MELSDQVYQVRPATVLHDPVPFPHLQEEYGPSWVIEKRKQEAHQAAVAHALVRMRRSVTSSLL